jgi:hypothetical protein
LKSQDIDEGLNFKVNEILTLLEYVKEVDRWKVKNEFGVIGLVHPKSFRRLYPVSSIVKLTKHKIKVCLKHNFFIIFLSMNGHP